MRFITSDARTRRLLAEIRTASPLAEPVLVRGETGVGKELAARLIHEWSGRGGEPFVPVNGAALTRELFGSALFGHERGSFTGAVSRRPGLLEAAGRGTLFLDEIAELDLSLQAKLLRLLDNGEFLPVGSDRPRFSGARIVAATNRDLEELMEAGRFRRDLFYRINVLAFSIPPLRARRGDIMALADHFLSRMSERAGFGRLALSDAARALLVVYDWPGNVRELEAEMVRAAVSAGGGLVRARHLSPPLIHSLGKEREEPDDGLDKRILAFERREIERALRASGGNRSEAARLLGLKRTTLLYRMRRHGIAVPDGSSRID